MSDQKIIRAVMSGRVQGVGFRYYIEREAIRLGICGWVRNRIEGTVEMTFTGHEEQVEAMLAACRKGPPAAKVDNVDVTAATDHELSWVRTGERFSTLPTV